MRKERKYHYIYKITNAINEEFYIGMHSTKELRQDKLCMNLTNGGGGGLYNEEHAKKFHIAGGVANLPLLQEGYKIHAEKLKSDSEYRKIYCDKLKGNQNWLGKKHKEESKKKIGLANSINQKGEKNSQYGTHWITNGVENKKIKNNEKLPDGYNFGRKFNYV